MSISSPRIRSLLRQADKVAASGKRTAAEQLYRQILDEAPDAAQAWVGLALVLTDTAEQESALDRAYQLDPTNEQAKIGLTAVRNGQSLVEALNPEPEVSPREKVSAQPERNWQEPVTKEARFDSVQTPEALAHEDHMPEAVETGEVLYCANHPNRQTHLRCNKCGKPVCTKCIRPTPVGYRCKECVKEHQDVFYTATIVHYLIAAAVTLPLGLLAGLLGGLNFIVIFIGAAAGSIIARITHRVIGRRRGRWMPHLVAALVCIGGVAWALPYLFNMLFAGSLDGVGFNFGLIWRGIYIVIATSAAFYQMR